ncbi:MAG: hypothetical protein ACLPWD_05770 [Methanobacterium sp.]
MELKGIFIIIIIVFIMGFAIYGFSSNTTLNLSKNYTGNYLSFTYPSSWNIIVNTTNSTVFMMTTNNSSFFEAYDPESMASVAATDNVADNITDIANTEFANTNLVNITQITVDGNPGVMASNNNSLIGYHAQVYFAVGDNLYWYIFYDANPINDKANIDNFFMLINSTNAK